MRCEEESKKKKSINNKVCCRSNDDDVLVSNLLRVIKHYSYNQKCMDRYAVGVVVWRQACTEEFRLRYSNSWIYSEGVG